MNVFFSILRKVSVLTFSILVLFHCGSDTQDTTVKQKAQIPPHEEKLLDFFSESNRGKWDDLPEEHSPTVNVIKGNKNYSIIVFPPFAGNPGHYIESIILTDYALKEKDKKSFGRGVTATNTVFSLPLNTRGEFYVLLKCNLHDTWFKKIYIK